MARSLGGGGTSAIGTEERLGVGWFVELLFFVLFLTGVLHDFFDFNHDLLVLLLLGLILSTDTFRIELSGIMLPHRVEPSVETNLVVHHGQEGVNTLALVGQVVEHMLTVPRLPSLVSGFESKAEDLELSLKLNNLHLFVQLEVSMDSSHASIEQFVEVNPSFFRTDSHLEHLLFEFTQLLVTDDPSVISRYFHANWDRHLLEEVDQLTLFHLDAVELVSDLHPALMEHIKVTSECLDGVVFCDIVGLELLDNNQNEKVEHDVSDHQDE